MGLQYNVVLLCLFCNCMAVSRKFLMMKNVNVQCSFIRNTLEAETSDYFINAWYSFLPCGATKCFFISVVQHAVNYSGCLLQLSSSSDGDKRNSQDSI